jgi:putative membrane protein
MKEQQMRRFLNPMVAVAGAAAVVVPAWVWAQAPSGPGDYGYGPHMMWGFGMIFGPLFFILVLALLIAVAVLLVRWLAGPWQGASHSVSPGRTPLDILKERFARGEIDKDEFEERRRTLGE